MNILMLTTHLEIGGISNYIINLSRGLQAKGHTLTIASAGGKLAFPLQEKGITHIRLDIKTKSALHPKLIKSIFALYQKNLTFDIVHAHTRVTQILGHWYSRLRGIPLITTCHGFFKPKLARTLFPCWGDKTIAISEAVATHLENDFKVHKENIHTIYNGIDPHAYTITSHDIHLAKMKWGVEDFFAIGIVARLSSVKGHKYLFLAFKTVLEQYPFCKLLVIGDGEEKHALIKLAASLKIMDKIMFIHETVDTREIFAALDLFIMPSINEGLGLAILEAMASGVPVIASDVGGIGSIIKHKKNGILVKSQNSPVLAEAMQEVISQQHLHKKFSSEGKNTVLQKFTLHKMVDETEDVYKKAIVKKA